MKRNKHDNLYLCKNVNINNEYENEESIYHSILSDTIITFIPLHKFQIFDFIT